VRAAMSFRRPAPLRHCHSSARASDNRLRLQCGFRSHNTRSAGDASWRVTHAPLHDHRLSFHAAKYRKSRTGVQ